MGLFLWLMVGVLAIAVLLAVGPATPAASGVPDAPQGAYSGPPVLSAAEIPDAYRLRLGGPVSLVDLGSTPVDTSGADVLSGPGPLDLPFGPNMPIWTNPMAQNRPTMAVDSTGRIYVAFEHAASPTNDDIYIAWSDDGGASWTTPVAIASSPSNERNPNVVISQADVVTVFIEQDANPNAFAYVQQVIRGGPWNTRTISTAGAPISDFEYPSFVANGAAAYGMYGLWCTDAPCSPGSWSVIMFFNSDVTNTGGWSGIYFAQPPDVELFHPSAAFNAVTGDLVGGMEIEIDDDLSWDLTWFRYNPASGFFSQDGLMCGTFCPSSGFVWPSISVDGNRIVTGAHFNHPILAPVDVILAVVSTNGGTSYGLVNANQGTIDNDLVSQKYVSFYAKGTAVFAGYRKGTDVSYVASSDTAATFGSPFRVSDNTPGTLIDEPHAVVVTNTTEGPVLVWHDSRDGDPNIYFTGFQKFTITVDTLPGGLQVRFDGGAWNPAPIAQTFLAGSVHAIETQPTQSGGPTTRYMFVDWDDLDTSNPKSVTVTADATFTARFRTQYQITMQTVPSGLALNASGAAYTGPFWCDQGSVVNVEAPSPQPIGPTSRYRFDSWSDLGARIHDVTCDSGKTLTAVFATQYLVTVTTSPAPLTLNVDGSPAMSGDTFWFDVNSPHILEAVSPQVVVAGQSRYRFDAWADGPTTALRTVVITGSTQYTATYVLQYNVTVATSPPGLDVTVDTVLGRAPRSFWWDASSLHDASAALTQPGGTGVRYVFSQWSDGTTSNLLSITADAAKTVTAIYGTEYWLDTSANVGTVSPPSGWQPADQTVDLQATPPSAGANDRYTFDRWTGDFTGSSPTGSILMDGPKGVTANWIHQFRHTVSTNPTGLEVEIDGVLYPAPQTDLWWDEGSQHQITAVQQSPPQAGSRYLFQSWSTGATTETIFATSSGNGPFTFEATFKLQHQLNVNSAYGGPTGGGWYDDGTSASFSVTAMDTVSADERKVFLGWTGDSTATSPSASITMDGPKTVTAQWKTQYKLTVTSDGARGNPRCDVAECWYDEGATASFQVDAEVRDASGRWLFVAWTGDFAGASASGTITMDGSRTVTATWRQPSFVEEFGLLLGILIAVIAALLIAFFLWRRRKAPEEEGAKAVPPPPPPAAAPAAAGAAVAAPAGTIECPGCNMVVDASAVACPICGTQLKGGPSAEARRAKLEEAYKAGKITKEQYEANLKKL